MYIDTHAHVLDTRFDADREETFARAADKDVRHIIEVACDPSLWEKAVSLTEQRPSVRCVLGIHPQDAKLATPELLERLETLCRGEHIVGVGETGLDYYYENSPRDVQQVVFRQSIEIARKTEKPIIIHCRQAYDDLLKILSGTAPLPGVIHCFSGSLDEAKQLTAMGFYIGIDGPATYPSAKALKEVVRALPLDVLLLETDSPYLPPQSFRGKRNEPSYLPLVAKEVATLKDIPVEAVAAATTANARKLFSITEG